MIKITETFFDGIIPYKTQIAKAEVLDAIYGEDDSDTIAIVRSVYNDSLFRVKDANLEESGKTYILPLLKGQDNKYFDMGSNDVLLEVDSNLLIYSHSILRLINSITEDIHSSCGRN